MENSVPGTAAAVALPPSATPGPGGRISQIDESQFTPQEAYLANETYAGRNPLNTNLPGLFQTATGGPAANTSTQNEIYKAQHVPLSGAAGTTTLIDPTKGNAPGNVVSFGDPATSAAETKQRGFDIDDAKARVDLAENAGKSVQEVTRLRDMYNTLVASPGGDDTLANLSDDALKTLSESLHFNFTKLSKRIDAQEAIRRRMAALAGNAVQSVAVGSPPRGILENANQTLANPESGPEQFNSAVDQMLRGYKAQLELGGPNSPADRFRRSRFSKEDSDLFKAEIQAILDRQNKEFEADSSTKPPAVEKPSKRWIWNPKTGRTEPQ
jgi:hypothetical protein